MSMNDAKIKLKLPAAAKVFHNTQHTKNQHKILSTTIIILFTFTDLFQNNNYNY
jgi:hypothetical protein